MTQLEQLAELYEEYQSDPRFKTALSREGINFVPGVGPMSPDIMLIGEQAGKMENHTRAPFVGRAGNNLATIMGAMKIDVYDIYLTNVIKCWLEDPLDPGKTRNATRLETQAGRDFIRREISIIKPRIVGLCGLYAIQSIYPNLDKIYGVHGLLRDNLFVPLYHPAVYSYSPHKRDLVEEGYKNLVRYSKELKAA